MGSEVLYKFHDAWKLLIRKATRRIESKNHSQLSESSFKIIGVSVH